MKKILFFALALAASVLAITSCKKDKNAPEDKDAVVYNAVGELRGVMFDVYNENQHAVVTYYADKNTSM